MFLVKVQIFSYGQSLPASGVTILVGRTQLVDRGFSVVRFHSGRLLLPYRVWSPGMCDVNKYTLNSPKMALSRLNSDDVIDLVSDSDSISSISSDSEISALDYRGRSGTAIVSRASGVQSRYGAGGKEMARTRLEAGAATYLSEAASSSTSQRRAPIIMQAGPGTGAGTAGSTSAGQKRSRHEQSGGDIETEKQRARAKTRKGQAGRALPVIEL